MNQDSLMQMLHATIPRDEVLLQTFLHYQAAHFEEDWQTLVYQFIKDRGQRDSPVQVYHFETDLTAFVKASSFENAENLLTYTQIFGQAGLSKLPQLSKVEKDLVIQVALFNLATRFQLLDSSGQYQSVSVASVLRKSGKANLVNVFRVANNLADRISRDIEQFLLTYEPKLEPAQEEVEDSIQFRSEKGYILAYRGDLDLSQYDQRTGKTTHLSGYDSLNLADKFSILSHFDHLRNAFTTEPDFQLGAFDPEMEMVPVYERDQLITYMEANGSPYELQRELTNLEMAALGEIGRRILAENQSKLEALGIDTRLFETSKLDVLLDAVGRFHLKDEDLRLLADFPQASLSQLALATELLQMGLGRDKVSFFLTSQLDLEHMRPVAHAFLQEGLTIEEAQSFEVAKRDQADLDFSEWRATLDKPKPEWDATEPIADHSLVQEVSNKYPSGTRVSYKGQDFEVLGVEVRIGMAWFGLNFKMTLPILSRKIPLSF